MRMRDCFKEGLLRKTKPSKQYAIKSLDTSLTYIQNAKDNLKITITSWSSVLIQQCSMPPEPYYLEMV